MNAQTEITYVNNVPLAHGELSIVLSDNAEKIMQHSHNLAATVQEGGVGVLLINCGISERRFREHAGYPEGTKAPHYMIRTSYRGDLIGEGADIREIVDVCKIGIVIIAGWEWASSSYRRKERLLYFLRALMAEREVAVIVYSQASTKPVVGKYDRGGVGKLAMIAAAIITDSASASLETYRPKPFPIVAATTDDMNAAERSAQLLINKINDLRGDKPKIILPKKNDSISEKRITKSFRLKDKEPKKNDERNENNEMVDA